MKKSKNIIFSKAGNHSDIEMKDLFLSSHNRMYRENYIVYHRNRYETTIVFSSDVFTKNFNYDRKTGIYRYKGDASATLMSLASKIVVIDFEGNNTRRYVK